MSKYSESRRIEIEKIIYTQKKATVKELAEQFNVTTETIRTDLEFLEQKGVLLRTHGGAIFQRQTSEPSMDARMLNRMNEKKELARQVLDFIDDGSLIYIDNASTSLSLANLLNTKRNCTIVTNSIELVNRLYDSKHDVYLLGGKLSKKGKRTYGDFVLRMIEPFHFDVCILGMDGCKNTNAPANMNMEEVILNDKILKQSDYSILLSDGSKFELDSRYKFAEFNEFDCLITTKIPQAIRHKIKIDKIIEIGETNEQD